MIVTAQSAITAPTATTLMHKGALIVKMSIYAQKAKPTMEYK
jgi:hypothetical protein